MSLSKRSNFPGAVDYQTFPDKVCDLNGMLMVVRAATILWFLSHENDKYRVMSNVLIASWLMLLVSVGWVTPSVDSFLDFGIGFMIVSAIRKPRSFDLKKTNPTTSLVGTSPRSSMSTESAVGGNVVQRIFVAVKSNQYDVAEELLYRLAATGHESRIVGFNMVIDGYVKDGNFKKCEEWYNKLSLYGLRPNMITQTMMVTAYSKVNRFDKAEKFVEQFINEGREFDIIVFTCLIDGYAKVGKLARAEYWADYMENIGLVPNVITINSLIAAASRARRLDRAEHWYQKMKLDGVEPSVVTFNTLFDTCAKSNAVERAEEFIAEMKSHGIVPDVVTYNAIIDVYARSSQYEKAKSWMDTMIGSGIEPCCITYGTMMNACAQARRVPEAWELFHSMKVKPNIYIFNAMLKALMRSHEHIDIEEWKQRLHEYDVKPTEVSYSTIASAYARHGDYQRVESLMDDLMQSGLSMNHFCYGAMVTSYINANPRQIQKGIDLLKVIPVRFFSNMLVRNFEILLSQKVFRECCDEAGLDFSRLGGLPCNRFSRGRANHAH